MQKKAIAVVVLILAVFGLSGPAFSWSIFCPLDSTGKVAITYLPTGTTSSTVAIGNDSRITGAEQTANKGAASGYAGLDGTSKVLYAQLPTGTTANTVLPGNDPSVTNARAPTAHASTHVSTGSDPIAAAVAGGASGLLTGAQATLLANTSGSNSGDETLSTIKTKLGITTLSGANTGDQTISITGDVTASGSTGALSATVTKVNGVLMSTLGSGILKNTTGTGAPSIAVSGTDFKTINSTSILGSGDIVVGGGSTPTGTGWRHVTSGVEDGAASTPTASNVGLGSVTNAAQTLASIVPNTVPAAGALLVGNAGATAYASVAASGDVLVSSTGAHTIQSGSVTLAKQANLAANSIQGNNTGSAAAPIALTVAQTQTLLLSQPRGYTTTSMAGTTTTLTNSSTRLQVFTGSGATSQTVVLPDATTMAFVDSEFEFDNATSGTGSLTAQANGGGTLYIFGPGGGGRVSLLTKSVAAGTWEVDAYNPNPASGKVLNVSNSLTLAGTDGTKMTFPGSSATIARTDAANSFTGVQTMTSPALTTPTIGGVSTSGVTGSVNVVLSTSPTLTTPVLGAATGTSLAVTGAVTSSGGGIGYVAGAGGTVTQGTNRSTAVTLSKLSGNITMFSVAQASQAIVTFTLTNTFIAATDNLLVTHISATNGGAWTFSTVCGAGSATITVRNVTAASITEATPLRFTLIKGATS